MRYDSTHRPTRVAWQLFLSLSEPQPAPIKNLLRRPDASPELRPPMTGISPGLASRLEAWVKPATAAN